MTARKPAKKKKLSVKEVQVQRLKALLKLGQRLQEIPQEHFNMNEWVDDDAQCGFAACALGWAPILVPESKLKIRRDGHILDVIYPNKAEPDYPHENLSAAEAAFGLTGEEADKLFMPDEYGHDVEYRKIPSSRVSARIIAMANKKLTALRGKGPK
jgi:hypothetical protein